MNRNTKKYRLSERIVFLEDALNRANERFYANGKIGVSPDTSVSIKEIPTHYKKVRKILKNI